MLIRHKFYKTSSTEPYYEFSIWIYLYNLIIVQGAIRISNFVDPKKGKMKFYWLTLLVYFNIREPIEEWEIPEYFWD